MSTTTSTRECRCGRPLRDQAIVCDTCADSLARALGEVPWLAEELETTVSGQKGATYDGYTPRGAETPSPVHWAASEARTHLRAVLVSWVRFCDAERVANSSPTPGLPTDDLPAISRWLLWRVDGLTRHELGMDAVDEITDAAAQCHRMVDRPADRQFLGACDMCPDGRLYARPGSAWARCVGCDAATDADAVRARLLDELDDRLCTAAEIARLSTYLGLHDDREKVRNRINQWHKRGRITREAAFSEDPVFRFGIVWRLLVVEDSSKKVG